MPAGRRSAVASRRLHQQGKTDANTVEAPNVAISTPTTQVASLSPSGLPRLAAVEGQSDDGTTNENSFASLASLQTLASTSTREIEEVTTTATKVRLSRGQTCTILGACSLWVKDGTVAICGAIISASERLYHIYAPATHALPRIVALTKSTEVQLESTYGTLAGSNHLSRPVWKPDHAESTLSYFILDHSFELDPQRPGRYTILETDDWKGKIVSLGVPLPRNTRPEIDVAAEGSLVFRRRRVLVCGKRLSGVSTFSHHLQNHLLESGEIGARDSSGILLLDLDVRSPEFSPPGTISLVHVTEPSFGTPPTNLSISDLHPNRILQMHFVGLFDNEDPPEQIIAMIQELLEMVDRSSIDCKYLVINGSSWLNAIDADLVASFWQGLQVTDVVALGARLRECLSSQPWQDVWEKGVTYGVHEIAAESRWKSPQELLSVHLQSYFCFQEYRFQRSWWSDVPPLGRPRQVVNLFRKDDQSAATQAVIIQNGQLALQDVVEALEGVIVALIEMDGVEETGELEYTPELVPCLRNSTLAMRRKCLGLAYIAEVEPEAGLAHLLSPVNLTDLAVAIVLDKTLSCYSNIIA